MTKATRVNPGTSATLLGAVLTEVETLRDRVLAHDRALAPAFRPAPAAPMRDTVTDTRGPGEYRREPVTMRQASSSTDPWAGDVEHSAQFMAALADGANIAELRRQSADHMLMQAVTRQPAPVIYETPQWCAAPGCRPATPCGDCRGQRRPVTDDSVAVAPPGQTSVVHRDWHEFHRDARDLMPEPPPRPEPGAVSPAFVARQQAERWRSCCSSSCACW